VDVFVYKAYFTPTLTRITYDRFKDRLKKFEKSPGNKPLCIYGDDTIICPWLHLEKTFRKPSFGDTVLVTPPTRKGSRLFLYVMSTKPLPPASSPETSPFERSKLKVEKLFSMNKQDLIQSLVEDPDKGIEKLKSNLMNNGENYCLVEVKENRTGKKAIPVARIRDEMCKNLIDEIMKASYEYIRSQYIWLKKEMKPRGYVN